MGKLLQLLLHGRGHERKLGCGLHRQLQPPSLLVLDHSLVHQLRALAALQVLVEDLLQVVRQAVGFAEALEVPGLAAVPNLLRCGVDLRVVRLLRFLLTLLVRVLGRLWGQEVPEQLQLTCFPCARL